MTQIPTVTGLTPRSKPGLDIYGVLLMIAAAFVLAATIYVFYQSYAMLGNVLPVAGD